MTVTRGVCYRLYKICTMTARLASIRLRSQGIQSHFHVRSRIALFKGLHLSPLLFILIISGCSIKAEIVKGATMGDVVTCG